MAGADRIDFDELEENLRALAYSPRLELLHRLRVPHALPDLRVAPGRRGGGDNPERPLSRQALTWHLEKLVEAGIVVARDAEGKGRTTREYVVNPRRLYQVTEEFRRLSTVIVGPSGERDATVGLSAERSPDPVPGPKLVVVHGAVEGKPFPLQRAALRAGRGWILGRKDGLHVNLPYDPFVSLENSEVVPDGDRFLLMDLRTSKNGTSLNWQRLEKDARVPLRPGDVVGVGRSLLVFRVD